jgi:phosphate transport system substrate-binding protein
MKTTLAALIGAVLVGAQALGGTITVKGSDTMVVLAQKWAEVYMQKNPDVKIQVTGGGSGTGFAALQNGQTDLANASRPIKAKEQENFMKTSGGKRPLELKVAMDGITLYVNQDNPLNEISMDQLEGIFTGKIKNWKELGGLDAPITVYSRENSSGTYEFFKEHVLHGRDFVASAQTMQGTAAVVQAVKKDKTGIGYGGAASGSEAKHLKVAKTTGAEAIDPSEETVLAGKYPLSRYLYVYLNPAVNKGEIAAYLTWIRSDEAQNLAKQNAYYPIPQAYRSK